MKVKLNNGVHMPLLGLGTFMLKSPEVENITDAAFCQGYRLIDTAAVYRNEESIGQVLKKVTSDYLKREEIFITSKLGPSCHGSAKTRVAALASLDALQLSYLDLFIIHWPGTAGMKSGHPKNALLRKESWLELEKCYQEGKFRSIGVSNYTLKHMEELLDYCNIVPAVLQLQTNPTVCEIAENHSKTSAQVLLRWAIEHQMSVIPKTSHISRLKENKEIFDFSLTQEDISSLDNLHQNKHYCWDPKEVT